MVGRADLDVIKSQFYTKNRNTLLSDDAELDALLEAVASEPDPTSAIAASQAVQDYLAEQAYVHPALRGAAGLRRRAVRPRRRVRVGRAPAFYDVWLDKD